MNSVFKKFKKVKKEIGNLRSKKEELSKQASINDICQKSGKYFTCQECHTRYPKETLKKFKIRIRDFCSVCSAPLLSRSKLDKIENLKAEIKLKTEESEKLAEDIKKIIEDELKTLSRFIRNHEGTYVVEEWRYNSHCHEFNLMFRNNEYATHESYGHFEGDQWPLLNAIESYGGELFGAMAEVSCNYCEKEWFEVSVMVLRP